MDSTTKTMLGFIAGVSIGAFIGVLYAPQKGATTRRRIARKGTDIVDDFKDILNESVDEIKDRYESTKRDAKEWVDKVKR
jgi:gas vesicle protein